MKSNKDNQLDNRLGLFNPQEPIQKKRVTIRVKRQENIQRTQFKQIIVKAHKMELTWNKKSSSQKAVMMDQNKSTQKNPLG